MIAQYIRIGEDKWNVLVYYNAGREDIPELRDSLEQLDCSEKDIRKSLRVIYRRKNTGFTFSNTEYKMSMIVISKATSVPEFVNTAIHEAKHVQSHICSYYDIHEDGEEAAYLIGDLVERMYKMLLKVIKQYV